MKTGIEDFVPSQKNQVKNQTFLLFIHATFTVIAHINNFFPLYQKSVIAFPTVKDA